MWQVVWNAFIFFSKWNNWYYWYYFSFPLQFVYDFGLQKLWFILILLTDRDWLKGKRRFSISSWWPMWYQYTRPALTFFNECQCFFQFISIYCTSWHFIAPAHSPICRHLLLKLIEAQAAAQCKTSWGDAPLVFSREDIGVDQPQIDTSAHTHTPYNCIRAHTHSIHIGIHPVSFVWLFAWQPVNLTLGAK